MEHATTITIPGILAVTLSYSPVIPTREWAATAAK
jgi:hypothetical protein